ncbi:hypothetical protein P9272_03915 [Mesorhizobium sp. WSM4976]|uniref:hypothetical protein n=1 Tax=Mesorhizobium sp. WSM4976 TaxID=3038549 RepID=UPI002417F48F|nr:hypothetical protein [Mesorhizobium sp. WSM4976]MDG4892728.1 hypothetical protein [Mesorhizobium sp. WSM4976]
MSNGEMWLGVDEAKFLIESEKTLVEIGPWKRAENRETRSERHIFETRVAVAGTIPRGVWFRITFQPSDIDSATFQLDCDKPVGRTKHTLYRLDWRPTRAHTNGYHGPAEFHGLHFVMGQTHDHICLDHVIESEGRIRSGDVQCARPINPDFENFDEALAFACAKLNIVNRDNIPPRSAQGSLF